MIFDLQNTNKPIGNSLAWITTTILGEVAIAICILSVAFVGFAMLTGRIPIRRGAQVILGCFLLLGAPAIAASLMGLAASDRAPTPRPTVVYEAQPREALEPANNSPYAGASSRRRND